MEQPELRKRKNKNKATSDQQKHQNKHETPTELHRQSSTDEIVNEISENGHDVIDSETLKDQSTTNEVAPVVQTSRQQPCNDNKHTVRLSIEIDLISIGLFVIAVFTRFVNLSHPNHVVFDELHYVKYVALYMKRTFFFDQHPPLGKQLVAGAAYLAGFNGNYTFTRIGTEYTDSVPIVWMRAVPAMCGSILVPVVYKLLLQLRLSHWTAVLGGLLICFDNALVTQSQFVLMESMLVLFSVLGLLFLLKNQEIHEKLLHSDSKHLTTYLLMLWYACLSAAFFTFALCVKYAAFYSCCLGIWLGCRHVWRMLSNRSISNLSIAMHVASQLILYTVIPVAIYVGVFWVHLQVLNKAGPHDSVMTSAFQASLEGGLASITKGQPLNVAHGSQVTLRHTHGRTCWLHSHAAVYPVRYPDKRGSSHQQQVTCYSFKDVNNWWIVKRPEKSDLIVGNARDGTEPDAIKHDDVIQLVHGITSRALNSHDVAAAMTPQSQEVSCYIDYNVSMPAQILWRVDIINRDQEGHTWHTIKSQVRLIHATTGAALRFTGRQLPDWGYNQHEVVADRNIDQLDTIWNVEEHRYTKTAGDQRERERDLVNAEMIPTKPTSLSFFEKFIEIQHKMLWHTQGTTDGTAAHMYSSEPLDWPLLNKGIAYWIDRTSNAQIHLLGNVAIWYSGTAALMQYLVLLVVYLLRRRRQCYDIDDAAWSQFCVCGEIFLVGYLMHFLPYFFVERTMFLHNYLPALVYKILVTCAVVEHLHRAIGQVLKSKLLSFAYNAAVVGWLISIFYIFKRFSVLSYGLLTLSGRTISSDDIIALRWKDTWDFILHKDLS